MTNHVATCRCGALRAECLGEPVRVSVCHCLDCQRRSGSAFATQARWPDENVTISGAFTTWSRVADSGHAVTYRFCPTCGSTVAYEIEGWPGVIAVPVGNFADPDFPGPKFSVYEHRKHRWAAVLGEDVEHFAAHIARGADNGNSVAHHMKSLIDLPDWRSLRDASLGVIRASDPLRGLHRSFKLDLGRARRTAATTNLPRLNSILSQ